MLQAPIWDKAVELETQNLKLSQFLLIKKDMRTQTSKTPRG